MSKTHPRPQCFPLWLISNFTLLFVWRYFLLSAPTSLPLSSPERSGHCCFLAWDSGIHGLWLSAMLIFITCTHKLFSRTISDTNTDNWWSIYIQSTMVNCLVLLSIRDVCFPVISTNTNFIGYLSLSGILTYSHRRFRLIIWHFL